MDVWNTHILACSSCGSQFKAWQGIQNLLRRENSESAPAFVIHAAGITFEPQVRNRSLREVVASVLFDSFSQPALASPRRSEAVRQVLLSAEEFDIHLRISVAGGQRRIVGQILSRGKGTDVTGTQLRLRHGGKRIETAEADRFGEFELHEITEGALELEIELSDVKITGDLKLG